MISGRTRLIGAAAVLGYMIGCTQLPEAQTISVEHQSKAALATQHKNVSSAATTRSENECIMGMLRASSLESAKGRRAKCGDSFAARASYAWLLEKFHAPEAVDMVIQAMPRSSDEMNQFFSFYGNSSSHLVARAYTGYYHMLFQVVRARPQLLHKFFAIADQFGTDSPNVDEETWFCVELGKLYRAMPERYMQAVATERDASHRRNALSCRSEQP